MGDISYTQIKNENILPRKAITPDIVCEDCGSKWTAMVMDIPVCVLIDDLDKYSRMICKTMFGAPDPPLFLYVFRPTDIEPMDTNITLSCVVQGQSSPLQWIITHNATGLRAPKGCQIMPKKCENSSDIFKVSSSGFQPDVSIKEEELKIENQDFNNSSEIGNSDFSQMEDDSEDHHYNKNNHGNERLLEKVTVTRNIDNMEASSSDPTINPPKDLTSNKNKRFYDNTRKKNICPFKDYLGSDCQGFIEDNDDRGIIKQNRSIDTINESNKARGANVFVEVGSMFHKSCRQKFNNPKYIEACQKRKLKEEEKPTKLLRLNNSQDFNYATNCLFCENIVVDENGVRHSEVCRVSTWNFQNKIICHCRERNDKWGNEVKSRITIAIDLPAKDALYHRQCSNNFRNNRGIPLKFRKHSDDDGEQKQVGRPVDLKRADIFLRMMDDFENNDETISINDLILRMGTMCEEPYSDKTVLNKLKDNENIDMIKEGQKYIITSKLSTSKILKNFHSRKDSISGLDEDAWKKEIVYTAARLMRADIDKRKDERHFYPNIPDVGNIEKQIDYVPFLLRTFLREIFTDRKTDMDTRVAAIGQAIMQQHRPRSLMAPLQFSLTMKVHDDCPGLLNELFKSGFCLSYDEANLFKSCAAADKPDPISDVVE